MKQDGHSVISSLLIAGFDGFDLALVCAFGWGREVVVQGGLK